MTPEALARIQASLDESDAVGALVRRADLRQLVGDYHLFKALVEKVEPHMILPVREDIA